MTHALATTPIDPRAEALADLLARAGAAALRRGHEGSVRRKADGSQVTDADLAAHEVLVRGLADLFPRDAVVSEEGAGHGDPAEAEATWWVDPLDGTSAFIEGLAHWGPTVCRVVDGALELGALHLPRLGEHWFAAAGAGAWHDGTPLAPQAAEGPRTRTVCLPSGSHHLGPLAWRGRSRSLGSSAVHLAQVAAGGAAASIVPLWALWDVGCGVLLVRETGGRVTDLEGADLDVVAHVGTPLVAAHPSVLPNLLGAVRTSLAGISES
ncbi:MAG: inositol monophosphatase family protein [Alphaproteobacteria bacterium]|nr:inositol monophosphatase family protein [Alphaproteobacteria bacterium]